MENGSVCPRPAHGYSELLTSLQRQNGLDPIKYTVMNGKNEILKVANISDQPFVHSLKNVSTNRAPPTSVVSHRDCLY
jgi:hypothetical protein